VNQHGRPRTPAELAAHDCIRCSLRGYRTQWKFRAAAGAVEAVNIGGWLVCSNSLALQVQDLDAPTGSGFWHWAIYNIPATATELPQGAGNSSNALPVPAFGGANDFLDTGATGVNGNYGGPCPPTGDKPHRCVFTLYALAVADVEAAGGIPKTGTPALHSFILNKGLGGKLLGKASFTARYQR
jgi:Raf kinase inhibitor-like YbhB/YbcL family protein